MAAETSSSTLSSSSVSSVSMNSPDSAPNLGVVTLQPLMGQSITLPLQDKLFWQYLKEDIVPAIKGAWFEMFGRWNTACIRVLNNNLKIEFDNRMRGERVLDKIPPGTTLYYVLWYNCGTNNWRTGWIGNACDTPLISREEKCPICFEKWDNDNNKPWMLECGHTFHKQCVGTENCPLCKTERTESELRWSKV